MTSKLVRLALIAPLAAVLAACSAGSESEAGLDIPAVEAGDIAEATMIDIVRELSSDEFEGRMPGTIGEEKTVALLIERFKAAGMQPGNGDSWVQSVPLMDITASNLSPLTIKGGDADLSFAPSDDWIGVSYRTDPKIALADSELVFVGYGINAPERGWNDYEGIDMTGKTAIILVNDPDYETEGLDGPFGGRAMTYYGRWTYKYEEAARQGAAGALIVHDTFPASYPWSTVSTSWSGPQGYAQRGDNPPPFTMINGWIQLGVAEQIFAAAGKDAGEIMAAAKTKGFKPVPLGLTASASLENATRTYETQNVIAMLPGRERPDEIVIHTAHWDHLGRCTPDETGDDICNGAIDNATGTAALVALAEAHAKAGPAERSLVFLAVTAEEQGLLGADYYAANPIFPLSQTVGGVNMDAMHVRGEANDVTVIGFGKSELDEFVATAVKADDRVANPEATPEAGFYYRSDHFAFAKRGVPMIYLDNGNDLVDGGVEAGKAASQAYYNGPYHAPSDEFQEDWDWSGVMQDLDLYYRLGRALAMSESWPNWVEGDEFRATRDASCEAGEGC